MVCNQSFVRGVAFEGTTGSISASLPTQVGRALLARAIGDDARYASTTQFHVERSSDGSWLLRPVQAAQNPTFLNGCPVPPEGAPLREGDQVSLAGKAGVMKVRIIREQ